MRLHELPIPFGKGVFKYTKRVSIELSNICNYQEIHKKCPLHEVNEKKIIPEGIVYQIIATCKKHEFKGLVSFHQYNEPGIDPRLMLFIDKITSELTDAKTFLLTNGWYLNQQLLNEYVSHGLSYINISIYSKEEAQRLKKLKFDIPYQFIDEGLDNRMDWYGTSTENATPCYSPLYEICIRADADVVLCPCDWKKSVVFGNLKENSLEEILLSQQMQDTYQELSNGTRKNAICKGCGKSRGESLPF